MNKVPKITLIILNWKKTEDTLECLRNAVALKDPHLEILLVDNHSGDGICERVRRDFPAVVLLENPGNLGYAGGNNAGIRMALERGADYVFILNNDAAVADGCLAALRGWALRHPDAGILAPKVLTWNDRSRINSLGTQMDWLRLRPKLSRYGQRDDPAKTEPFIQQILMGCALFVSKETIAKIGMLDERFFLIHEDADWCLRAEEAGLQNWVVPLAVVFHKESKSLSEVPALSHYYSVRNFFLLAVLHAGFFDLLAVTAGGLGMALKSLAALLFGEGPARGKGHVFFSAFGDFVRSRFGKCERTFG